MALRFTRPDSLKARITFATLGIFVLGIWTLAFFTGRMLREDMQRLLGDQQFATASLVAGEIDEDVTYRLSTLERFAANVHPALLGNAAELQSRLESFPVLQGLFNGGIFITRLDGTAIVAVPPSSGRTGVNYMDRDYLIAALREGRSAIGKPVIGRMARAPAFAMSAPIRDARGKVTGAIVGITDLSNSNFLSRITEGRYGKTGSLLLVSPKDRMIVTASDKTRIMQALPDPGAIPIIDLALQGEEGSTVLVNPAGVEVLSSSKRVAAADWLVVVSVPTAEVFAPVDLMQQRMLFGIVLLTLLVGGLTWLMISWMLKRQFSPMLAATGVLDSLSATQEIPPFLPVTGHDEIGKLIGGFNRLLETLAKREAALRESGLLLQESQNIAGLGSYSLDVTNGNWQSSEVLDKLFGIDATYPRSVDGWEDLIHPDERAMMDAYFKSEVVGQGRAFDKTYRIIRRNDRAERWVHGLGRLELDGDGRPLRMRGTILDVTERKRAETALRQSEERMKIFFDNVPVGICISSREGKYVYVNPALPRMLGYSSAEELIETARRTSIAETLYEEPAQRDAIIQKLERGGDRWCTLEHRYRRKDGQVIDTILSCGEEFDPVTGEHLLYGIVTDISERKVAEGRIEELAFFDQLTMLPNRTLLQDRMQQAFAASSRSGGYGALLFIDLDNFKTLNDTLGHDIGDELLKQAAQRLRLCVRDGDSVARLGGDEFVVVLVGLSLNAGEAATAVEAVAEKILVSLRQPYQLANAYHQTSASIGISLFKGDGTSIDELMKQADLAMYKSKEAGRNTLRFFDPTLESAVKERAALEGDLKRAVDEGQFLLHYQAQVTGKGQLTGAEVLLRWQHPRRGMVAPGQFIPLAEETGLILGVGKWVLETACAQLVAWAQRPEMEHLTVAVNVSAIQFRQPDFVDQVVAILAVSGANPQRLKLELTESLLIANIQDVIEKMHALKAKGVSFALDDFGTGYSSLSYLKRLPLDQLKIDQSFVRDVMTDPNDAAIARTVVALAHSLGLNVIAEGVETETQRDFLAGSGCHAYQGYFFSRPLPIEGFERLAQRA